MLRESVHAGKSIGGRLGRELVGPGVFVALILASNFALADLPNVKLFDLLVFAAGYTLGFRRGALVAIVAWAAYDLANPWGPASPMLLATKMGGEVVYAIAGAAIRRVANPDNTPLGLSRTTLLLAIAAVVTTVLYDITTNLYTGWVWAGIAGGHEYARWIGIAIAGPGALLFMVLHVGSNAILFPVFGPLLMRGGDRIKRSLEWE